MRRGLDTFLTESLIMTAVLAIAAALCLSVFMKAGQMRRRAEDLSACSSLVYSAVQCYDACGDIKQVSRLMGGGRGENIELAPYTLLLKQDGEGMTAEAYRGDEMVFSAAAKGVIG